MSSSLRHFVAAGALALSAGYAAHVSALPVGVTEAGGFLEGSESPAILDFSDPAPTVGLTTPPDDTFETISWVSGDSVQSMGVFMGTGGILPDTASELVVATIAHTNIFIPATPEFDVDLSVNVEVRSNNTMGAVIGSDSSIIPLSFVETSNDGSCNDNPFGTMNVNPIGSNCDDVVQVLLGDVDIITFMMGGMTFKLLFEIRPLNIANGFVEQVDPTTLVFWTREPVEDDPEGFTTSFEVVVRAQKVPEPGSLALLGLGLIGLTFAYRRQWGTSRT